jgi:hypothetical protein
MSDNDSNSPICPECGLRKCSFSHKRQDGTRVYKKKCFRCKGKKWVGVPKDKLPYYKVAYARKEELMRCEMPDCNFKAVHLCQLDIDHIDGDKQNNDPSNLIVLCANCHRLKTHMSKDYVNIEHRERMKKSE